MTNQNKEFRMYKISSANTPYFFIGSSNNPSRYLSQLLHNTIRQYNEHVLHDKKYSTCYYVIHENDITIELVEQFDRINDMKYAMDDIIRLDPDCINQKYHMEIDNKVLRQIRTTLTKNKLTSEQKRQYFKDYYKAHKQNFVKPEQQKIYYDNNRDKVLARNKARYEKLKIEKLEEIVDKV